MKKIGFCKQCLRNVPHLLYFRWPIIRVLNRWPEFSHSLPFASWHCCGCEKNTMRLTRPDAEVSTDVTSTTMEDIIPWPDRSDPTQRFGLLFRRKKKTKIVAPAAKNAANQHTDQDTSFEHVGNVTRSDESLLVRQARAARYSRKFRDSVVDRVLSGKATITQVRNELKLSERDVLDWINNRVLRQDEQIGKLTQVVDAVKQLTHDPTLNSSNNNANLRIHSQEQNSAPEFEPVRPRDGATIEGRVKRS